MDGDGEARLTAGSVLLVEEAHPRRAAQDDRIAWAVVDSRAGWRPRSVGGSSGIGCGD